MTRALLYKNICKEFSANDIEDGNLEARLIIEKVLNISYSEFLLSGDLEISDKQCDYAFTMAKRRIDGEPIQYVLGEWDFMGFTFKVGQGVLIPRPETEILCEYVCEQLACYESPTVFDLCSGSGCIGISVKKLCPDARVFLVEKSPEAICYLNKNIDNLCCDDKPVLIQGDILIPGMFELLTEADVIISNPPYIKSEEIPFLQSEVRREPSMALDGGEDGLVFYRMLVYEWSKKLKKGGFMAFECGEEQSEDIVKLFSAIGFDSEVINDYNNIQRIVIGRKNTDAV